MKRILSLVLAALMLLPVLTGCSFGGGDEKVILSNVFRSEELKTDIDFEYINQIYLAGDRIWINGYEAETYEQLYYSIKTDGTDCKKIDLVKEDQENTYLQSLAFCGDRVWANLYSYHYDAETGSYSESSFLVCYDSDMKELERRELVDLLGKDENLWIDRMIGLPDGSLAFTVDGRIIILRTDGTKDVIDTDADYISQLIGKGNDLLLFTTTYTDMSSKTVARLVDVTTGKIGEEFPLDAMAKNNYYNATAAPEDSAYAFYFSAAGAMYGFNASTGASERIIDWVNSDLNSGYINRALMISDTEAVAYLNNWQDGTQKLYRMTKVPDEELEPQYIITLACFYSGGDLMQRVVDYNKKMTGCRISVLDYSQYNTEEDWSAGVTRFKNDLIAGKVPDIMIVNNYDEISMDSLLSKGMFADLYPFIDKDEELSREDFLPNILKAYTVGGKFYEIIPYFDIQTVAGKTAIFGERNHITTAELREVLADMPTGTTLFGGTYSRSQLLETVIPIVYNSFIDKESGTCSFDSKNFIDLLEFCNDMDTQSIYDSMDWETVGDDFWRDQELANREDRTLLQFSSVASYADAWGTAMGHFGGELAYLGMPSSEDYAGSCIHATEEYLMSARSKHKDAAWEFLRVFLTKEYAQSSSVGSYYIPIRLDALAEKAAYAIDPERDENGDILYDGNHEYISTTYYQYDRQLEIGLITKEYADKVTKFITSVTNVYRSNSSVVDIIMEEAQSYFEGQRSAEEAAKMIQSRVQLYVSESR